MLPRVRVRVTFSAFSAFAETAGAAGFPRARQNFRQDGQQKISPALLVSGWRVVSPQRAGDEGFGGGGGGGVVINNLSVKWWSSSPVFVGVYETTIHIFVYYCWFRYGREVRSPTNQRSFSVTKHHRTTIICSTQPNAANPRTANWSRRTSSRMMPVRGPASEVDFFTNHLTANRLEGGNAEDEYVQCALHCVGRSHGGDEGSQHKPQSSPKEGEQVTGRERSGFEYAWRVPALNESGNKIRVMLTDECRCHIGHDCKNDRRTA